MKNEESDGIRLRTGHAIHHIGRTLQQEKNSRPLFSRHRMYHKIDVLSTKAGTLFRYGSHAHSLQKGWLSSKISVMIVT
eukprot:scaffold297622_cov56-Attheya_sp.AAC.9